MVTPMEVMAAAVKDEFFRQRFGRMDEVEAVLESPLEAVVLWAMCSLFDGCYARGLETKGAPGAVSPEALGVSLSSTREHWACLWPQLEVQAGDRKYRLDLAMWVRHGARSVALAVELDGHDFHERTAEQAERDKRRDRDLQLLGYRVLRFTGAQALRSPLEVVDQILGFADSMTKAVG